MAGKRHFVIEASSIKLPKGYQGLFESSSPYSAASKAAHSIFRLSKTKKTSVSFTIRESTQGSKKKEYKYTGTKTKYATPKDTGRKDAAGKPILAKHEYSIKSAK
jgi:hypothetical protein